MKIPRIFALLLLLPTLWAFSFEQNAPYNPFSPPVATYGVGPQSPFNPLATDPPKIYGGDGTYYGEYSSSNLRPDSISKPVGKYGNPMSPDSIFNPLNTFGAPMPYLGPNSQPMWPMR